MRSDLPRIKITCRCGAACETEGVSASHARNVIERWEDHHYQWECPFGLLRGRPDPGATEPLTRKETILLALAGHGLTTTERQLAALNVLSRLSEHLVLHDVSEHGRVNGAAGLTVEVDGSLLVDIDVHGDVSVTDR